MSLIGRTPIPPAWFLLAKACLVPPHLFLAWAVLQAVRGRQAWPAVAPVAVFLSVAGLAVACLAMLHLGSSLRVGLPDEPTSFQRRGLYGVSRNPIYAGVFLSMAGSCLLVPHGFNLGSTLVAILLHHRIVLSEEQFLEQRFGEAWRDHRAHVRRYV